MYFILCATLNNPNLYNPPYGPSDTWGDGATDAKITEVTEAAADMFLNWVDRTNDEGTAFADLNWTNREQSSERLSGTIRFRWMNCRLVEIFNQNNFWSDSGSTFAYPSDNEEFACDEFNL